MKAQLTSRLEELRNELKTGRETQIDLEKQLGALQQKIIYISGAVKVLEEELEKVDSKACDDAAETIQQPKQAG